MADVGPIGGGELGLGCVVALLLAVVVCVEGEAGDAVLEVPFEAAAEEPLTAVLRGPVGAQYV